MKILPFLALFSVLVFTSSYVSSKIEASAETTLKNSSFKQFIVHPQGTEVALFWPVSQPGVKEFAVEPGTIYYRVSAIKADQSTESPVA